MDGLEGPTSTTAIPAVDSNPPSPRLDPDFSPVGSPEHDIPDVPVPPSDDDHDHDHCEDPIKDHENSSTPAVLTDDLKQRIIKQVFIKVLACFSNYCSFFFLFWFPFRCLCLLMETLF